MVKELGESGRIIRNLVYEQYIMISLADSNQTANEAESEKEINKLLKNFESDYMIRKR